MPEETITLVSFTITKLHCNENGVVVKRERVSDINGRLEEKRGEIMEVLG